jgi:hypothetical protein
VLSAATEQACSAAPLSADCQSAALADINLARAAEGVGPMILPSGFSSLAGPHQLLVLANLERVARGLVPALGLSAGLNATAVAGALAGTDPIPAVLNGDEVTSNWAAGTESALLVDFMWMYDDGPGSGNLDCTASDTSGCWGHRDDILYPFHPPLVMGAAFAPSTRYGPSFAELFVGGDLATAAGAADAILAPAWSALSAWLGMSPAQAGIASAAAAASGPTRGSARLRIRLARSRIRQGARDSVFGRLTGGNGASLAGQLVSLWRRTGRTSTIVAQARTTADGSVRFRVRPTRTTSYTLRFAGSATFGPAGAGPATVRVSPR